MFSCIYQVSANNESAIRLPVNHSSWNSVTSTIAAHAANHGRFCVQQTKFSNMVTLKADPGGETTTPLYLQSSPPSRQSQHLHWHFRPRQRHAFQQYSQSTGVMTKIVMRQIIYLESYCCKSISHKEVLKINDKLSNICPSYLSPTLTAVVMDDVHPHKWHIAGSRRASRWN